MKVKLFAVLALLCVMALAVTPVFALQDVPPDGLSEYQFVIVGLAASALVWIFRQLKALGSNPSKELIAGVVYVASFALAVWFTPVVFPPFGVCTDAPSCVSSAIQWIGELLAIASPVAGFAYLIYNVILQRVLEGAKARFTKK